MAKKTAADVKRAKNRALARKLDAEILKLKSQELAATNDPVKQSGLAAKRIELEFQRGKIRLRKRSA